MEFLATVCMIVITTFITGLTIHWNKKNVYYIVIVTAGLCFTILGCGFYIGYNKGVYNGLSEYGYSTKIIIKNDSIVKTIYRPKL